MQGSGNNRPLWRRIVRIGISVMVLVPTVSLFPNFAASKEVFKSIPLKNFSIVQSEKSGGLSARNAFRGAIELRWKRKRFGGFSGLHLDRTGKHMMAISDRGVWFAADLVFKTGRLTGVRKAGFKRLRGTAGDKLKRRERDAEALSPDGSGGFVVAFERSHRLLHYPGWRRPFLLRPRRIKAPPGLHALPENHGIEAMTRLCDGRYLIIAEGAKTGRENNDSQIMVWLGNEGRWTRKTLRQRSGGFTVAGASTLSDCSVAIIERRQIPLGQWVTIIQRFPSGGFTSSDSGLVRGQILLGPFSSIAKFEGIAVHKSNSGDQRLFLITDNDFKGPTILAAFAVALR
jgi:hypothetical protein